MRPRAVCHTDRSLPCLLWALWCAVTRTHMLDISSVCPRNHTILRTQHPCSNSNRHIEMAAARGLHGDPAQARRESPDPGRRRDGRLHLAAIVPRRRPAVAAARATDSINLLTFTGLELQYMQDVCMISGVSGPRRVAAASRDTRSH